MTILRVTYILKYSQSFNSSVVFFSIYQMAAVKWPDIHYFSSLLQHKKKKKKETYGLKLWSKNQPIKIH